MKFFKFKMIFLCISIFLISPSAGAVGLLVSSGTAGSVLEYNRETGAFVGDFVPPMSGGLDTPDGLAYGPDGNLYVEDYSLEKVLRYDGDNGAFIDNFTDSGASGDGLVFGPDGNLYTSDNQNDRVNRYDGTTGALIDFFETPDPLVPTAVTFGPDGNLYVSSFANGDVHRFDISTGNLIDEFIPLLSGGLDSPTGLIFGPDGNLYVSNYNKHEVLRFNGSTGAFMDVFVTAASGGLDNPFGLVFGPDGNLYVASANSNEVLRYDGSTGSFIDAFVPAGSGGLSAPLFLIFAPEGALDFSMASFSINQGDGTATITVNRTNGTNGTVTVNFATSDGTAIAGVDYEANSGTLTFADGEASKTFTVTILSNSAADDNRSVNLVLSDPTGGAVLGALSTGVLNIVGTSDNVGVSDSGGGCQLSLGSPQPMGGILFAGFLIVLGIFRRVITRRLG